MSPKVHPYSRLVALGLLVSFLRPSRSSSSFICSRNEDCNNETDPNTFTFCFKPLCIVIAKSANQSTPLVPTTLEETVKDINAEPLSVMEKQLIVSSATRIMADFNPHRFLQLNLLNVDIVAELQNFSDSLASLQEQSNLDFHESMKQIFTRMNDFHTTYRAPTLTFAILGFRVEEFYITGEVDGKGNPRVRYVVADVVEGLAPGNRGFGVGAEILRWNGEDIGVVVKVLGERSYGSNEAAQMSVGVQLLTSRSNSVDQIPVENGVKIQYRTTDGKVSTALAKWFFVKANEGVELAMARLLRRQYTDTWREAHSDLTDEFRISSFRESNTNVPTSASTRCGNKKVTKIAVSSNFSELFAAEIIETDAAGEVGRIILPSFLSNPTTELLTELTRVLSVMPKNGLILDARDNGGGSSVYAKTLSTLVSGKAFEFDVRSVRANNFTLTVATNAKDSPDEEGRGFPAGVLPALQTAVRVGEPFSGPITGLPRSNEDVLSRLPRAFFGPVVSLVNGRTYSAGDTFAAVQVDKKTSTLVGTSDNVGAGGASTISYRVFPALSPELEELPGGVEFSTAFARFYRSGNNSGAIIENFGIRPQIRYFPTLKDAVEGDCDLLEFLGKVLVSKSSA